MGSSYYDYVAVLYEARWIVLVLVEDVSYAGASFLLLANQHATQAHFKHTTEQVALVQLTVAAKTENHST